MLNLRNHNFLRKNSLFGKIIRLPLHLIPDNMVIPILTGPLRGVKWIAGSHNKSVLLGTYEKNQTSIFVKKCLNKKVLWDLGAHVGYYTLLFKNINRDSMVYSLEPVERNSKYLKQHLKLNKIDTVIHLKKAVSDKEGILRFAEGNHVGGKLSETGDMTVPVVKLSRLLIEKEIAFPDLIKMDIEGAEYKVLNDLKSCLASSDKKPIIFLSTHGKVVHDQCLNLMDSLGYGIIPLDAKNTQNTKEYLLEPIIK
jgi:FkbM family methyltransferase